MKNSFRRISAGLAIVSAILLAGAANAADIKERSLKIAFVNIKEHPHGLGAQKFADIVAEKSGGKIKAKLFGGGTLGGDLAVVSSLQGGTVDMTMVVPGTVSGNIKEFSIFDFPLLFNSYEEADAVLDGPIGQRLLARLPEKGLIGLGYWDHGYRNLTNNRRPVAKLEDIQGLKIRVIQIPIVIDSFNALGANAVPMPLPEVYTALETGAVDGQENPYALIESSKYQEVQKYISTTQHIYNPLVVLFSKKTWEKLSISATGGGVPGLVATAVSSNGSVANISAVNGGSLESGFSQSDVAYWAYTGTGLFEGKGKIENLRAIATLYPETIHLVATKNSGIKSVADLKGKRVSLDEPGSGTLVDARIVLTAYGLSEKDVKAEYLKPGPAGDRLRDGALDAYFFVGGYPTGAISELATSSGITLVPIAGGQAEKMLADYQFFSKDTVPTGTYKDVPETPTISVNAQWVTSAKQPEDLVYNIVKTLWSDTSRSVLDSGHAKGKLITLQSATKGIGIPLHPGAEKFYREKGVLQ